MPDLGKAYVQIVPSAEGIKGSITSVLGGEVEAAGSTAQRVLGSKLSLGALAGGAAVAKVGKEIFDFAADAVQVGMGFDSSMSQVAATMGTTVDQIGELRSFAQEMGASTVFSATEAATALNYMALAGYDAQTSMDMLPNVLNLAAAGGIQLSRASDMITDAQSALGLSLEDTNVLVDQMAKASSKSNTSVEQLGDAILTIGATARNIKGGTKELTTVLGVLADNGIKGAEGGTHLRNILLSLQTPTKAGTEALEKLGMTYDDMYDAAGNMRSIPDIFLQMQDAMAGMTPAAQDAIKSGLFNRTDLAAVNALLGTSADRFDELGTAIENSQGAAQAMADTQLDNLSGDVTILKSAFEGLQIQVSDHLSPTLRKAVQFATKMVEGVSSFIKQLDENAPLSLSTLTESASTLYDTIATGQENLASTEKDVETTANTARRYIEAIEEMGDTASMTAEEHQKYHTYLVLLTQTIPGMADIIDLETDSINGDTTALRENVDAWEARSKAQAANEYLASVESAYSDVLLEQAANQVRLTQTTEDLRAAEEARGAAVERAGELAKEAESALAAEWEAGRYGTTVADILAVNEEYQTLTQTTLPALGSEINRLTADQDTLNQALDNNAEAVAAAEGEIAFAKEVVEEYTDSVYGAAGATEDAAEATDEATDTVTEDLAAWQEAYNAAYESAYQSISGQLGLFNEFSAELGDDLDSTDEMIARWGEQAADLGQYTENLRKASEYGLSEGLVQALSDGSAESAAYLAQIISDIEAADEGMEGGGEGAQAMVDEINAAFGSVADAKADFADTAALLSAGEAEGAAYAEGMLNAEGEVSAAGGELADSASEPMILVSDQAGAWGSHLIGNFTGGIRSGLPGLRSVTDEAAGIVQAVLGHSTPKEGPLMHDDEWGYHMMDNILEGIEDGESRMKEALWSAADVYGGAVPQQETGATAAGTPEVLELLRTYLPMLQNLVFRFDGQNFIATVAQGMDSELGQRYAWAERSLA